MGTSAFRLPMQIQAARERGVCAQKVISGRHAAQWLVSRAHSSSSSAPILFTNLLRPKFDLDSARENTIPIVPLFIIEEKMDSKVEWMPTQFVRQDSLDHPLLSRIPSTCSVMSET